MKKILITGFEPFGAETTNSSWDAITALEEAIPNVGLVKLRLPVSFSKAPALAIETIERENPNAVICVGQAGGRACVNIERLAVNLANAVSANADGYRPRNKPIIADGEPGLFTTIPVEELVDAVRSCGVPCHPSQTAGLYVCNTLLYRVLHHFPSLPITFVHMPYSTAQVINKGKDTPSMSIGDMKRALMAVITHIG